MHNHRPCIITTTPGARAADRSRNCYAPRAARSLLAPPVEPEAEPTALAAKQCVSVTPRHQDLPYAPAPLIEIQAVRTDTLALSRPTRQRDPEQRHRRQRAQTRCESAPGTNRRSPARDGLPLDQVACTRRGRGQGALRHRAGASTAGSTPAPLQDSRQRVSTRYVTSATITGPARRWLLSECLERDRAVPRWAAPI
jgi:hypothetical protein